MQRFFLLKGNKNSCIIGANFILSQSLTSFKGKPFMNILILNHYAGSIDLGMEYRPFYLAKEWEKNNHKATIIAGTYSHIRTKNPEIEGKYSITKVDGIQYFWIKTPRYSANGLKRFFSMLVFTFRIYSLTKVILKNNKYDAVIASSTYPLDIFPARYISKKCHAKLVYEVHDLWPLSPMELGGLSKWNPFIMLMQYAENFAYKKSDKVISLLPFTLSHMLAHGLKKEKWNYIPNGIDLNQWENFKNIPDNVMIKLNEIKKTFSKIVAYTGTFGLANALDSLLDASKLVNDMQVAFVLFGKGPLTSHLKERIEKENLENVFLFEPVPKNSIPHLLSLFDILYIGLQNQPLFRFGISPNKLIDYMMSAKPLILAIKAGNDMVTEADCGVTIEPEDPNAISDAIRKIVSMSPEDIKRLGENGKRYILRYHTFQYLASKFIEAIK